MSRLAKFSLVGALTLASTGAVVIGRAGAAACDVTVTASSLSPSVGFEAGGTSVNISGTNFVTCSIQRVAFGSNDGVSLNVVSNTSLIVTTPAGSGSVAPVLHLDNQAVSVPATFTFVPAPRLTSLRPPAGPEVGGTTVTVSGTNMAPPGATTSVLFGTAAGALESGATSTSLTVVSPAASAPGPTPVTIVVTLTTGENSTSNQVLFDYIVAPSVTSASPATGPAGGGNVVTVDGTGFRRGATVLFGDSDGSVDPSDGDSRFGSNRAAPVVEYVGPTQLRVIAPSGVPGVASVVVQNPDTQFGALTDGYTHLGVAPVPTAVDVTNGPSLGGTDVSIDGTGFEAGATVFFGSGADQATSPSVTVVSATQIIATTPPHAPSAAAVAIKVVNANQAAGVLDGAFTYDASAAPTLTGLGPAATGGSLGGTLLTLDGTGFAAGAQVSFGTPYQSGAQLLIPDAPAGVVDSTRINVTSPAHPAGAVDVVVTNPDGQTTSTLGFTYTAAPAPTINSAAPATGPTSGGTEVTIDGTGFAAGAQVLVGGVELRAVFDGDGVLLPIVRDATTLIGTTANHAAGAVDVVVINPDASSATAAGAYTYTGPAAPVAASISPDFGDSLGGLVVTIGGSNFAAGSTVEFGTADCTTPRPGTGCDVVAAAADTEVLSSTSIRTSTPAGLFGFVNVSVVGPDGVRTTLPFGFDYGSGAAPPIITAVTPATGPSGTPVTIQGTGFAHTSAPTNAASDAVASVGAKEMLEPDARSGTEIVGNAPVNAGGTVNVTVVNPDRQGAILIDGFSYPVDTTAPVTVASATTGEPPAAHAFGATNWAAGPVTVALDATDGAGGSGVERISYRTSGAQTRATAHAGGSQATVLITAQGVTTLTYFATDVAGIVEASTSRVIAVDSVRPSMNSATTFIPGTQTTDDVEVTFTCSDGGSGVVGAIAVASSDTITTAGTNPVTVTFTELGLGQAATATCTDAAGNVTTTTLGGINISRFDLGFTAAATTADGQPYTSPTWTNQDVVVTFTCRPAPASVPPGSPQIADVTAPSHIRVGSSAASVTGTCVDTAGNSASTTFDGINVDKTKPLMTATLSSGGAPYVSGEWTNQPVLVTFGCTDDGPNQSGVATMSAPVTIDAAGATAGVTGVCADVAGNVADPAVVLGPILIDQTPPTCTVSMTPNPVGPRNNKLTFVSAYVVTDDDRSGVAAITLVSVTSSRPGSAANDISGFAPGTDSRSGLVRTRRGNVYTFTYVATDSAGSSSAPCSTDLVVG